MLKPQGHPLLNAAAPIGIISGEGARFPTAPGGHEALRQELNQLRLPFEEVRGHYGAPERSFIVHGVPRAKLFELGKKYGQESVIHGNAGQHEFIYTNGDDEGYAHPGLPTYETWAAGDPGPDDNFTKLPDGSSFRLHFDFNKKHPSGLGTPAQHPMLAAGGLSRHEIGYGLYQALSKVAKNIEPNLLPRGIAVANEKDPTIPELMHGLYQGLKKTEAELLALTKKEAEQNEAQLVKGEKNYDCVKCGEQVRGLHRKDHALDEHKRGGTSYKLTKNAGCDPLAMKIGDGAISDPSTEKSHAGKPFKKASCKTCGKSLCKCGDMSAKKYEMPAGSSPTSPGPKPGKTPDQLPKPSIPAPGSGGQIKKAAMPGSAPKAPGAAPKMPGATAKPTMPKTPKPPVMGAGTPAPNVKSEIRKDLQWKGPFAGAPKPAAAAAPISAAPSVPQMLPKPPPTMPGVISATPGTTIPGLGAAKPAAPAPVKTMAERVAAKVPASSPSALTPAQASAPPLFSQPTAPPPPSTTPGLFPNKK